MSDILTDAFLYVISFISSTLKVILHNFHFTVQRKEAQEVADLPRDDFTMSG